MSPTKQLYLTCKEYITYLLITRREKPFRFPFESEYGDYCPVCLERTYWKHGFRKLVPICKCGWSGDALDLINEKEKTKLKIIRERKLKLNSINERI